MSNAEFRIGDSVAHYQSAGTVGTVVSVRRRWWAFFGRTYSVQWREGCVPVVYTHGLFPASTREGIQ